MAAKPKKLGIIRQVALFFAVGVLMTGAITYFTQHSTSYGNVKVSVENIAAEITEDVRLSFREYPAYEWLLEYWREHAGDMDVSYEDNNARGEKTAEKYRKLTESLPGISLRDVSAEMVEALSPEDQKLFAEVLYSRLIARMDQIKLAYRVDYLFCVVAEDDYRTQFFLLSAAEDESMRGTEYGQVYPLGHVVSLEGPHESQQQAMRFAKENEGHLADAGNYVDYYSPLSMIGDRPVLIGITYDLQGIWGMIDQQTLRGTLYAVGHHVFLSLICLALILFFVLRPLRKVQQNIRLYKETKDSAAVNDSLSRIRSRNEIGQLSDDVMGMTKEIDDYLERIEKITGERERIGTELALASRIQASMLPNKFPERADFDLYATMDPAKEVGGDFYDFFLLDDSHLAMVIADVSGKGIPAALFMMVSMILIHEAASRESSPSAILREVNDKICSHNPEEMFVTVWLGILDLKTGELTASNAGHEYPVLKQPDGHFEIIRNKHSLVIGAMGGIPFNELRATLSPGAKLFVYTDGLPEATDAQTQLFGLERMQASLRKAENGTPQEILKSVDADVAAFVGGAEQFDDLTMLCLEYRGPGESAAP